MVYEQWSYRRPILVTENSGSDLSDYAVKIVLNSSNFDSWDKVNPDGSDIRFTDDQGNPLSYWIEKFDYNNQEAIIWVKIPVLQANQQITIYMYYGNPNAVSEEDPESVFSFFDDFEDGVIDSNKWNITADQEGAVVEQNGTLIVYGSSTPDGVRAVADSIDVPQTKNAKLHARLMHKNLRTVGNKWYDWFTGTLLVYIDIIATKVGYQWHNYPNWVVGYGTDPNNTNSWATIPSLLDSYHNIELYTKQDGHVTCKVDGTEYSTNGTIDVSGTEYVKVVFKGECETNTDGAKSDIYVDYVFIRSYTDPEPSVTIMSEEYVGVTISVYDSLLVQNAYISLQRVLETSILVSDSLLVQNANISLSKLLEPSILVSDSLLVKNANISISKLLEPSILVSDLIAVQNAEVSLVRTLEPSILVSNALLVQNAYISISRSSEPVILVSDDLLVQNAYVRLIRTLEPSILVSDSLLVENAYIQMLASSEPFITVRDTLLVQNANISLQRLLETIISISGLWAVRNATVTLQRTKEVVTKPSGVSAEGIILFASALGILYALAKKREEEKYGKVSYY